jgi:hypothetical protein
MTKHLVPGTWLLAMAICSAMQAQLPECRTVTTWVDQNDIELVTDFEGGRIRRYIPGNVSITQAEYNGPYQTSNSATTCDPWVPNANYRVAFCGQRQDAQWFEEGFLGISVSYDTNYRLLPRKSRFFYPITNAKSTATRRGMDRNTWDACMAQVSGLPGPGVCCGATSFGGPGINENLDVSRDSPQTNFKFTLNLEVNAPGPLQDFQQTDRNLVPPFGGFAGGIPKNDEHQWGNCQTLCAYGVAVSDCGCHACKPELHPTEALWWKSYTGTEDRYFLSVVDTSDRFTVESDFDHDGAPSWWRPWAETPFSHWYQVAFSAPDPADIAAGRATAPSLFIRGLTGAHHSWNAQVPGETPSVVALDPGGAITFGRSLAVSGTTIATASDNGPDLVAPGVTWSHVCVDHRFFPARVRGILNVKATLGVDDINSFLYFRVENANPQVPPALPAPVAPTGCSATAFCSGQIKLSCPRIDVRVPGSDPSVYGVGGIRYQRASSSSGPWTDLGSAIVVGKDSAGNFPMQYVVHVDRPGGTAGTVWWYRAVHTDYALQVTNSSAFSAAIAAACPSVNGNIAYVSYPFDPGTSCLGGPCSSAQQPARPTNVPYGRVVSVMSARGPSYTMAAGSWPAVWPGQYWNITSLYCLDVANGSFTSGTDVNVFPCHNPNASDMRNQQWILDWAPGSSGQWSSTTGRNNWVLRSAGNPNLCLNVRGGIATSGADLQIYDCTNGVGIGAGSNQFFSLPGRFAFDSRNGAPDLKVYLFPTTTAGSTGYCLGRSYPCGTASCFVGLLEAQQCSLDGTAGTTNAMRWVLYDWETRTLW